MDVGIQLFTTFMAFFFLQIYTAVETITYSKKCLICVAFH